MPCPTFPRDRRRYRGFTIIELLTVMAVLGILMAILIPVVGGARNSAKRAKTRVQFAQWATAIEGFRQEYGYYPDFTIGSSDLLPFGPDGVIDEATPENTTRFVEALSGRQLDGQPLTPTSQGHLAGNTKRISFLSFSDSDLARDGTNYFLQDAFGNRNIVLLYDLNGDGIIRFGSGHDYPAPPALPVVGAPSITGDLVRASVIFYSPGLGQSSSDIVKSWE